MEIIKFKQGKQVSIHNQLKELNKNHKLGLNIPEISKTKKGIRNKFSIMYDEVDYYYSIAYTYFENKDNKNAIIYFELAQTKFLLAQTKVELYFKSINKTFIKS